METKIKGMPLQGIAGFIETMLRSEYGIKERGGLGGIIDANHIRNYKGAFYYCMAMALIKYYSDANSGIVDKFINDIDDIKEMNLNEIKDKRALEIQEYFSKVLDKTEKEKE
jgi:hypothetical protein